MRFLVEKAGVDINQPTATNSTPLRGACYDGHLEIGRCGEDVGGMSGSSQIPRGQWCRHRDGQPTRSHTPHDILLSGTERGGEVPAGERGGHREEEPQR